MAYTFKVEQFEGPLDLLLQLIEKEKLEITEISLAALTEQYLKYLGTIEEHYPEELADFLVVASRLLLLKSRFLLPEIQEAEEDEASLTNQLKLYKIYLDASKHILRFWEADNVLYQRPWSKRVIEKPTFSPPQDLKATDLRDVFITILSRLEPIIALPKATIEKVISLHEKIQHIQTLLSKKTNTSFSQLLASAESRTEVIVTFLAILELVKRRNISVHQPNLFSDITIEKNDHR